MSRSCASRRPWAHRCRDLADPSRALRGTKIRNLGHPSRCRRQLTRRSRRVRTHGCPGERDRDIREIRVGVATMIATSVSSGLPIAPHDDRGLTGVAILSTFSEPSEASTSEVLGRRSLSAAAALQRSRRVRTQGCPSERDRNVRGAMVVPSADPQPWVRGRRDHAATSPRTLRSCQRNGAPNSPRSEILAKFGRVTTPGDHPRTKRPPDRRPDRRLPAGFCSGHPVLETRRDAEAPRALRLDSQTGL